MYVSLSVMRPNPGQVDATADSMRRFAAAARTQAGCVLCSTFRDEDSGELVGIAVFESQADADAAGPACLAAVEQDDFEVLVAGMENRRLVEA